MPREIDEYYEAKSQNMLWDPTQVRDIMDNLNVWFKCGEKCKLGFVGGEVDSIESHDGSVTAQAVASDRRGTYTKAFPFNRVGQTRFPYWTDYPSGQFEDGTLFSYSAPSVDLDHSLIAACLHAVAPGSTNATGLFYGHRDSTTELVQCWFRSDGNSPIGPYFQIRGSSNDILQGGPDVDSNYLLPYVAVFGHDTTNDYHFIESNGRTSTRVESTKDFGTETFNSSTDYLGGFNNGTVVPTTFQGWMAEIIIIDAPFDIDRKNSLIELLTGYMAWRYGTETILAPECKFANRPPLRSDS